MNWMAGLGLGATALGALCMYLAAPQQRWLAAPWPRWLGLSLGAVGLIGGWRALAMAALPLAATFVWLTCLMLVWAALPYLAVLIRPPRER
ncbi:hypothetical protein PSQ40_00870 [Curvibacter sp. HBC61]|uniref:DUF3325 domain-containing protein n=1 Tax=Curvibacter cyanobacteriorum TaxID=3026422 RepID=A0ABT5MWK1_9BURK|nr:hypothetical protein [Curvibacter sp. HBC61]MDD0837113.1 hypothetical protein [Curvibacter sp. HBC61]